VKVFLTDDAIDDLRWATQYYGTLFPEGLENFINNYTTTKMLLSDNPLLGRKYERVGGVRILNVVRTPFAFFYRATSTDIQILRVWDQRQDRAKLRL